MARLKSTVASVWSCFFVFFVSALELCSFPMRVRKLDWKLFLSAAHHRLPPDAPTAPLSPHALFPLRMWTLSIPPSPVRLSGKCLCPRACPQGWMLCECVDSVYCLFTLQLNSGMGCLGWTSRTVSSLMTLSLPSPLGSARDAVCCEDVTQQLLLHPCSSCMLTKQH